MPPAPQQPTFSAKVEAVRVDVLVTSDGRPVAGLGTSDFEVRDNGVLQDVAVVSTEQLPLNVVLALDVSDSVKGVRLTHLRAASEALIGGLPPRDRAALLTFSHLLTLASPLTADLARVRGAIAGMQAHGATALFDATYTGMVLGEADTGRSLLIVFTDGADTASFLARDAVLGAARSTEVVVYGAAVALPGRSAFVKDVAERTGGSLLELESIADLPGAFLRILDEFRQRYVLTYTPKGVASTGWHRLEVQVKGRRVLVKARAGYQAGG
jgi:tight adherence protein B